MRIEEFVATLSDEEVRRLSDVFEQVIRCLEQPRSTKGPDENLSCLVDRCEKKPTSNALSRHGHE